MKNNLKTLEEHESLALKLFHYSPTKQPNGIACPQCGEELSDDLTLTLASYPPQVPVFCDECGYHGSRH